MFRFRAVAVAVAAVMTGMTGFAALAPKFAEWTNGPVQWLMTHDEQRAWRGVATDEQAQEFIDLFWARRDPTPGTPLNEFHVEFDQRVAWADKALQGPTKRGALTDRGRVCIVLGPPKNAGSSGREQLSNAFQGGPGFDANRQLGAKVQFEYDEPIALGLTGRVTFVENLSTHELQIDFQQGNVAGALAKAVEKAIVSPALKEAPEWAKASGAGNRPVTSLAPPRPEEVASPVRKPPAAVPVKGRVAAAPAPVVRAGMAGAHDLLILANPRAIRVGEENPFAAAIKKTSFRKSEDIGFAYQYCTPAVGGPNPTLTMSITFSATIGGEPVSVSTPEDEVTAETITSMPACYLVRGAIPLDSLEPGSYQFYVNVKDSATGRSYNLQRDFKLE